MSLWRMFDGCERGSTLPGVADSLQTSYLELYSRKEATVALSIKTEEADRLARELSRLTGESMTDAITRAMRERLERLRTEREAQGGYEARVRSFVQNNAALFDRRPVTKAEWDAAVGDTPERMGR